jgi:hypothetical protein
MERKGMLEILMGPEFEIIFFKKSVAMCGDEPSTLIPFSIESPMALRARHRISLIATDSPAREKVFCDPDRMKRMP